MARSVRWENPAFWCALAVMSAVTIAAANEIAGRTAEASPRIENMEVVVRDGTVQITYDLVAEGPSGRFLVKLQVSKDEGRTWTVEVPDAQGDVGPAVAVGTGRRVTWRITGDETGSIDLYRYRVIAEEIAVGGPDARAVPTARASIAVLTDPPGAVVFIDGTPRGPAPVKIADLPAGEHRVVVTMNGYLENSQTISVTAGASETVRVALTPAPSPGDVVTAPPKKGGGGGAKWLIPVAAGGGVAALLAAKSSGGGGSGVVPITTSTPLPTLTVSLSYTPTNATVGVTGVTNYAFTGTIAGVSGTASYSLDYGDGSARATGAASGSSIQVNRIYSNQGTFTPSISVTDTGGRTVSATAATLTTRSLNGTWSGRFGNTGANTYTITIAHTGTSITSATYDDGSYRASGTGTITESAGSAQRAMTATLRFTSGPNVTSSTPPMVFSASAATGINAGLTQISGTVTNLIGPTTFVWTR